MVIQETETLGFETGVDKKFSFKSVLRKVPGGAGGGGGVTDFSNIYVKYIMCNARHIFSLMKFFSGKIFSLL